MSTDATGTEESAAGVATSRQRGGWRRLVDTPARAAIAGAVAAVVLVAIPCGVAGLAVGATVHGGGWGDRGFDGYGHGGRDRRFWDGGHDRNRGPAPVVPPVPTAVPTAPPSPS